MIKVIFALALLSSTLFCVSSAQRPQTFIDEVYAYGKEFDSEAFIYTETELESSFIFGEYDWALTENDRGEYEVNVHAVPASDATNLEGALTNYVEKFGKAMQDNADEVESEQASLFKAGNHANNLTAADIRQFGGALQANASQVSADLVHNYDRAAANYAHNVNHITDQLNSELNSSPDQARKVLVQTIVHAQNTSEVFSKFGSKIASVDSTVVNNGTESVNSQNIN